MNYKERKSLLGRQIVFMNTHYLDWILFCLSKNKIHSRYVLI